jgi:dephospho-CoA kinase
MNTVASRSRAQRIIGLTGGIAMGKTTVSNYLAEVHQLPILDADVFAREAVEPGQAVLQAIAQRYGSGMLLPNGQLNRQQLATVIFSSPAERLWVEQCIHPFVRDRFTESLTTPPLNDVQRYPVVVMVIPLLFEARMVDLVTETWVVFCSEEGQIERLMERDSLTWAQAKSRISSQMPIQKKMARANVVLENTSTLDFLLRQVDQYLHHDPAEAIALG